jgi:hypothetical protein
MFEKAKLNRDDQKAQKAPVKPHDVAKTEVEGNKAPDLPDLGATGASVTGDLGRQVEQAENNPAEQAEQQKELARVQALPPGDPELESFKKPEALAAQMPEGSGASGAAKSQAQGMSPQAEQQAPATLGANAQQVTTQPGGDAVDVKSVEVPKAPPVDGEVAAAMSNAQTAPPKGAEPTEVAAEPAAEPPQVKVAAESPEAKSAPQPTQLDTEAPKSGADTAAGGPAPAQVPAGAPESVQTGDASAEGMAGAEPQKSPDIAPPAVAAAVESVPQAAPAAVTDAQIATPKAVAPAAVAAATIAEVQAKPVGEKAASAVAVPEASVAPTAAAPVAEAPKAEAGPSAAPALTAPAPQVASAAAQTPAAAPTLTPAEPGQAQIQAPAATAPQAPAPVVEGAKAAVEAPPSAAAPATGVAGGAPAVAPAATPTVSGGAAPVVVAPAQAEAPVAVTEVPAVAGPDLAVAAAAPVAAAPAAAPEALDAGPQAIDAVPAAAALAPAPQAAVPAATSAEATPALQLPAGSLTDPLAGQVAAGELGSPVFGQTAEQAENLAQQAAADQDPDALQAISQVAEVAGLDPKVEVAAEAAGRAKQVEQALAAGPEGAAAAAQSQLPQQAQEVLNGGRRAVDQVQGAAQADRLAEQGMEHLQRVTSDPTADVRKVLGEGAAVPGQMRQKAEQSLGRDMSDVRVHTGEKAKELADLHGATAFAQGADIVMGKADELADPDREQVMAEELAHVVQMGGEQAATRGATGVSSATDEAEQAARQAAEKVLDGAKVLGLRNEQARRAIYRNDGTAAADGPKMPERVELSLGGKKVTANLPQLQAGTTSKRVSLPSMGIPGLTIKSAAMLKFDSTSGQFKGGFVDGALSVGTVMNRPMAKIKIEENGDMTSTFDNTPLKVGSLIDANVTATVAATGVTGKGTLRFSDLRGDKLTQWLKSGSVEVNVSSEGAVTGSGSVGIGVGGFTEGTLAAKVQDASLSGAVTIQNAAEIALAPKSTLTTGTLTGQLSDSSKVDLSGDLQLSVETLGGQGKVAAKWDSESEKVTGAASLKSEQPTMLGKANVQSATLTGQVTDSQLTRLDGDGKAQFDSLFEGNWTGGIDLTSEKVDFTLGGKLVAPIIQNEVTVSDGSLTIEVKAGELTSTAGNVDFKLGSFLTGSAVLEEGTNANTINATATTALVSPQAFDGVTLSQGSITLKVRGPQVEVVSGSVDLVYRDVAKGALELTESPNVREFSGSGKAKLNEGLSWGDIQVKSGAIDLSLQANKVDEAQGQMKMGWRDNVEGQMSFDAKKEFTAITGTATAHLTGPQPLSGALTLTADEGKTFDLDFKNSTFDSFKGAFGWEYEKFAGEVTVAEPLKDFQAISGEGKADLNGDLPIGVLSGTELMGKKGSSLTGVLRDGSFIGVKGSLNWQYSSWLAGKAVIAAPKQSIESIDGTLDAQVIAAKTLPNNTKVEVQPGAAGALRVELVNSQPKRYSGTLDFIYDKFLQGQVAVAGDMLDFSTLAGESAGKVIGKQPMGNVEVQPGSTMNVKFVDSEFSNFDGSIKFLYKDWLKGTAQALPGGGSSVKVGVIGAAEASLTRTPTEMVGDFKVLRGGKVNVDLEANKDIASFKAGSQVNWKYSDWLSGKMTLDQDNLINSIKSKTTADVKEKQVATSPSFVLKPSSGVGVEFAASTPVAFTGSVAAAVDDWLEGTLAIGANTTATTFNGKLTGALAKEKPVDGTPTTLTAGGTVTVDVVANFPEGVSGTIPFKYGDSGAQWLGGTVDGKSGAGGLRSLAGAVTASVLTPKPIGSKFTLEAGGALSMPMANANIANLGGTAAFTSSDPVAGWLKGDLTLNAASTTAAVGGDYTGKIAKELPAGVGLKLLPGSDVSGLIEQNTVRTLGGQVKWQYEDWLQGKVEAAPAEPAKLTGSGDAKIIKELPVIPGQLFLVEGGGFTAKLDGGSLTSFSGSVPFRYEDWLKGKVEVTDGTRSKVQGPAKSAVTAPGKTLGSGATQVKLLAGGSLTHQVASDGVKALNGEANAEFGEASTDGKSWHIRGTANLQNTEVGTFRGTVQGGLVSERFLPPSLRIQKGGNVGATLDGPTVSAINGSVNYTVTRGDQPFVGGTMNITAAKDPSTISGDIQGTVQQKTTFGKIDILPGGSLAGAIENNNKVTLGGKLAFQYDNFLAGTIALDGQLDPNGGQVQGEAQATTLAGKTLGPITVLAGSAMGAKVEGSEPTQVWGTLMATATGLMGSVEIPRESNSTPTNVSGTATFGVTQDLPVGGSGLVLASGSLLTVGMQNNAFTSVAGTAAWKLGDWLTGSLTVESGGTFEQISGSGTAQLAKNLPVGGTGLVLLPGSGFGAKIVANELDSVGGSLLWQYGADGWVGGSLAVPDGTKIDAPSGTATATLKAEKAMGELVLLPGGGVQVEIAAGNPTSFQGDVLWAYGSDRWLKGTVSVGAGSGFESISGQAVAAVDKDKPVAGSQLVLKKGGSLTLQVAANEPGTFDGEVAWQYQDWVKGTVTVQGGTKDDIRGEATATLIAPHAVAGTGLELQPGGAAAITLEGTEIQEFGGSVEWKYSAGIPIAQGSLTVEGKTRFDSITGDADAQLLTDLPFGDLTVVAAGSNIQAHIAQSKIETFGGTADFTYGGWLKGNVAVDPKSTVQQISGKATAAIEAPYNLPGTELTLQPGGGGQVTVENSAVKSLDGTLPWTYGADEWLKGTVVLDAGSTPDKLTGSITATLAKNYILDEQVSLLEGGTLTAQFDGSQLQQFSGQVGVGYEDWLQGDLAIQNSNLEQVNGTVKATLILDKALDDKFSLLRGGSAQVEIANNQAKSFTGDVNWRYEQWLEGNLHVDVGDGKQVSGSGTATLKEQKAVGDGKLELQRGGALRGKFNANALEGVGGEVGWKYDEWLEGNVSVPDYSTLDAISGTATAKLSASKDLGNETTLKQGGDLQVDFAASAVTKLGGQVEWRHAGWLGGSVTLNPSAPDHLTGQATASVIQRKEVAPPFAIERGGNMQLEFDTAKSLLDVPFSANLAWDYEGWLAGEVDVQGSTFTNLNGNGRAYLKAEKDIGDLKLRRGGELRAAIAGSKPDSFGGDLNWQFQSWLAGTLSIQDGSKLDNLSGKGTAALLEDKPLAGDLSLKAGGALQAELAANKLTTFGGTAYYKYSDWLDGTLQVDAGSTLESVGGKGNAAFTRDYAVGGSELFVKQGSSAEATLQNSQFQGVSGELGWKFQNWAEGNVSLQTSKLESIDGNAQARVVAEKPVAGELKLLPGGSAEVDIKGNALQQWGGEVRWQYSDLLQGSLSIEGKQNLDALRGKGEARLIRDFPLSGTEVKLLSGSGFEVQVSAAEVEKFSGKARFQYSDWLQGAIELTESTPKSVNGLARAQVIKPFAPGGGQFELRQGGNLEAQFKNNAFDTIEGEAQWEYKDPKAHLDGAITIPKSPVTAISGKATGRLLEDTAPVAKTKLLAGGNLELTVANSKPENMGGRIDWEHDGWIGGWVEIPKGTPVAGPYGGKAGAILKADKPLGDKFTARKGGNVELELAAGASVEDASFQGRLAIDYDSWLRGTLTADAGSNFRALSGSAQVELIGDKEVGSSGLKLLQGGNAEAKFANNELTTFGGVLLVQYEDWLAGSIRVDAGSTVDSISGRATVQLKNEKKIGDFTLVQGGSVTVDVAASKLGTFGGLVNWTYQEWAKGDLVVDGTSTFESVSGHGAAVVTSDKPLPHDIVLKTGSNLRAKVVASAIDSFGGNADIEYQKWIKGGVTLSGDNKIDSLSGQIHLSTMEDKDLGGQVKLKKDSRAQGQMEASKITTISGTVGFEWTEYVGGMITVASGSTLESISGQAQIELLKDKDLGGALMLKKGGNAQAMFDGTGITNVSGQLSIEYDKWLLGSITATGTLDELSGKAVVSVVQEKTFGKIAIRQNSSLEADFTANAVTEYRGNIEVGYEEWLKGTLNFKAQDLNSVSGTASLEVINDHDLVDPISLLKGSYLRANFEASSLKDFGGTVRVGVREWGKGELTVRDGSTAESVSGSGKIELEQPKKLGDFVTITRASLGADFEANQIKSIYGEAEGEVKDFGKGWIRIDRSSTLTSFTGQAGLALEKPKPIGKFAELSGGKIIANFENNALKDFGGRVDITVFGWGKGTVEIESGSTMESIKGTATLTLTERKELAGGKVAITGGSVSATVDGQKLTRVAGRIEAELTGIAKGELSGEIDVEKQEVSGTGKLTQIKAWTAGPVKIEGAELQASVSKNKLMGATGKGTIDAGKFGRGTFDVNYEDVGGQSVFYGTGEVEFQPHDRVKGKLGVTLSRDQKFTGEGSVDIQISKDVHGMAGVALDDQGHVKLRGSVNIPGPFELFKPEPYKKDITLLDLSFVVYTPPTVKVKVGAGLGIECGIKPLTLSNISLGGEVDLMEPAFASMSVTGHLASSAYCDLNAYVEGSVQVSAAVVAVEAGLRAALNLHLEAALSADPTITVDRNGLNFDMPVDAKLTAALNLVLTFFAKVKVGLDVGIFSVMATVWSYDKSPDPLKLAEMSVGAKGRVQAGAGGFTGTMNPEYQAPDLSLSSLKRALHLD